MALNDDASGMEIDEKKSDVQEDSSPKFSINGLSLRSFDIINMMSKK